MFEAAYANCGDIFVFLRIWQCANILCYCKSTKAAKKLSLFTLTHLIPPTVAVLTPYYINKKIKILCLGEVYGVKCMHLFLQGKFGD